MSGRVWRRIAIVSALAVGSALVAGRYELVMKRVDVVAPGKLVRGAWQRPWPLSRLIDREDIRTIVTLTAINTHDPKYVDQRRVVDRLGVDWVLVPMRGSTATLEQLAEAADLLADPARQPVFFHCVAGHHRTNLALAAYRIRHEGWSAADAWSELTDYPWTRPEADADDRLLIEAFAALHRRPTDRAPAEEWQDESGSRTESRSESDRQGPADRPDRGRAHDGAPDPGRLAMDDRERRDR